MDDSKIINYLNQLYFSDYKNETNETINVEVSLSDKIYLKNLVKSNTSNYIFLQKYGGPYCRHLEKAVSLSRETITSLYNDETKVNKKKRKRVKRMDIDIFSSLFFTLMKHNNLTKDMHNKFNRAILIPVYKSGDKNSPQNYRYLYNYSNMIKLLDKIWANNVCLELRDKLDGKKYLSYHIKSDVIGNIRTNACKFTNSLNNKIMLDFEKAFDNLSFFSIKQLLKDFLIRHIGIDKGTKYFEQYFNIIINTSIYYKRIKIKKNKGLPTGLSSSNLVFTAIMDQIFYIYNNKFPDFMNYFNYYVYVDDVALDLLNDNVDIKKYIDPLLQIFEYYKFKYNIQKCFISNNILFHYPNFKVIDHKTKYLGIYFSRNLIEYSKLVLDEFNSKNNLQCINIADMIKQNKCASLGFLRYKLAPFYLK